MGVMKLWLSATVEEVRTLAPEIHVNAIAGHISDRNCQLALLAATPIEMINGVIDSMAERQFGRIVNITSISVEKSVIGPDLSSGVRAGLTTF